jgi:hypothetical protein
MLPANQVFLATERSDDEGHNIHERCFDRVSGARGPRTGDGLAEYSSRLNEEDI